ncbi:MAG: phosphoglucomutase/phosphomannomutase family protein, partial [Halobacteria archaeon]
YVAGTASSSEGDIVRSIATTHLADKIAEAHGIGLIETPVGFKWLAKAMIEKNGLIAGEESGGVCFRGHVAEKDGLLTALFLAEMIAAAKKPLSQLVLDLKKRYGDLFFGRISVGFQTREIQRLIEKLKLQVPREIAGYEVVSISTLDGLKLTLKDGAWLLIRPSGTEPVVRIYGEAASVEILNKILAEGRQLVEGVD